MKLTRIQELLGQQGLVVKYTTLRRFVRQAGLWKAPKSTVRMAETAPGEVAELDFGKLGRLVDPTTGKGKTVWALVIVLTMSRYSFVWPLFQQTLDETITVLTLDGEGIAEITTFIGHERLSSFGLPEEVPLGR